MNDPDPYRRLAAIYDEVVVEPCHDRWAAFVHDVVQADDRPVRDVLDVCCGTGLMGAALRPLGYRVAGVDASDAMLARARTRLGPDAVLVRSMLPRLDLDGVFDAAVSTLDGLNHLTPAALAATVAAVGDHLRPGGWFLFDLHTDAMMRFTAEHPTVHGEDSGLVFRIDSSVDLRARMCDTSIVVTRTSDGDTFTEHHRQHFFTDSQVRAAARGAGFDVVAVTDDYTHRPVDAGCLRASWVLRREERPGT